MPFTIPAEVHTDDNAIIVEFDAVQYFEQANDCEIVELMLCEFSSDYAADNVAIVSESWYADIGKVLSHTSPFKDMSGFECYVDEDKALAWLKANRPALYAKHVI